MYSFEFLAWASLCLAPATWISSSVRSALLIRVVLLGLAEGLPLGGQRPSTRATSFSAEANFNGMALSELLQLLNLRVVCL